MTACGMSVLAACAAAAAKPLPKGGESLLPPDAPWRAEAKQRIEKHRKGDLEVRLVGPDGRAVAGADVAVRMKRHAFGFGSAVNLQAVASAGEANDRYRKHIFELFNRVVDENDLKWPAWDGQWGPRMSRERSVAALKLLRKRGFTLRGHCMVWPSWRHVPRRARELRNDPAALRKYVRDHIRDIAGATKGLLDEWDVINEPFSNHDLMDVCGKDVMVEWFQTARAVLPKARLFINDYAILAAGGATDTAHQKHYEQTIRYLLEKGAPLGGIGLQSHFRKPTAPATLWKILDRFAKFRLPLAITEFDFDTDDEQLQAQYTRDFMTAVFAHPAVEGFLMWGFWAGRHWRPRAAMFTRDWSIRPNGRAYKQLVFQEWWTDADGKTDARGALRTRGFLGDYEVTVTHGDRKTAKAVRLTRDGTRLTIRLGAK